MNDPSLNAGNHWMTSRCLILPTENIEEFNLLTAKWFAAYDAPNQLMKGMIGKAAEEEWFLLRYQRSFDKTCEILFRKEQFDWTEAEHKKHQRCMRDLTAQTRAARAAHRDIQYYRREQRLENKAAQQEEQFAARKAENVAPPLKLTNLQIIESTEKCDLALGQFITVRIVDGKTITTFDSTNREMLQYAEDRSETVDVIRSFYFPDGPAPEYNEWLDENGEFCDGKLRFSQTMKLAEFRVAVTFETDGIVRPYPPWPDQETPSTEPGRDS